MNHYDTVVDNARYLVMVRLSLQLNKQVFAVKIIQFKKRALCDM